MQPAASCWLGEESQGTSSSSLLEMKEQLEKASLKNQPLSGTMGVLAAPQESSLSLIHLCGDDAGG